MTRFLIPFLCILIVSCKSTATDDYPKGIEHVIVIGVDGLSPDGIKKAKTPVIDDMIANGAVKWKVRTVLTTASSQNWASMIMGAGPEAHGIIDNDWERDNHTLPAIVAGDEGIFPTIFGRIREAKPNAEIGAVYNWSGFGRLFEKSAVNYDKSFKTEDSTCTDFTAYIKAKKPTFGFVHFDHVDHAGHHDGHGTPVYYESVAKTDSLVGEILKAIKEAGMEENTLVIITSDHGGVGKGHGGPTPEEGEIAMVLYGKGVKKGYVIQQQVYTYDLAASIAYVFNITPPYAWTGRPIKPAFDGHDEPVNLWKGKEAIAAPTIYPDREQYKSAGGLFINKTADVSMKSNADGAAIHYTTDGTMPTINSPVYSSAFQLDKTTVVQAKAFDKNGNESVLTTAYFRIFSPEKDNGLKVDFYIGEGWKEVPVFSKLKSAKTWNSHEFGFEEAEIEPLLQKGNPAFGLVFSGYIQIDQPGKYRFYTQSDDGSILYINNKKVVDNDGDHGVKEAGGDIELEAGRHPIRIDYFNGGGGFWLDAFYKLPNGPKQLIPAEKLFLVGK